MRVVKNTSFEYKKYTFDFFLIFFEIRLAFIKMTSIFYIESVKILKNIK